MTIAFLYIFFNNLPHTLFLDGHDSRIDYKEKAIKKSNFYSYIFKNSGLRTQVIYDLNEFAIYVSDSKPCKNYNDGQMFLDMKLENILNQNDCIAFDGGYYYYIENCDRKGNDKININNFIFPIRKHRNVDLNESEILGVFRPNSSKKIKFFKQFYWLK